LLNESFVSDCRFFPGIYISQGSVAMRLRRGGIFSDYFIARFWRWKNFENRSTFGEVMGKSRVCCFLTHTVYMELTLQWHTLLKLRLSV